MFKQFFGGVAAAFLVACVTVPANAQSNRGPNWNYVEGGYIRIDVDSSDINFNGFGVGGSVEVSDNLFLSGAYGWVADDSNLVDLTLNDFAIGGGVKFAITKTTDIYGFGNYLNSEISVFGGSATLDGFNVGGGIRSMVSRRLEVDVSGSYTDFEGFGGAASGAASLTYFVSDRFGFGAAIARDDDATSFGLLARVTF